MTIKPTIMGVILLLLLVSNSSFSDRYKRTLGTVPALEVTFLSVSLGANGLGTLVARPCDVSVECDLVYARIDTKTKIDRGGIALSNREARRIYWGFGVLAVDEHGAAVLISVPDRRPVRRD